MGGSGEPSIKALVSLLQLNLRGQQQSNQPWRRRWKGYRDTMGAKFFVSDREGIFVEAAWGSSRRLGYSLSANLPSKQEADERLKLS
ncbi:unnamed protein product [Linum trigynum]|uniref:Uncharacterized protein n=1 Tax=Linum trigynum TaxID=586398 RepID=A0AAV2DXU5_9ROSI